jgi:hypothetical protein
LIQVILQRCHLGPRCQDWTLKSARHWRLSRRRFKAIHSVATMPCPACFATSTGRKGNGMPMRVSWWKTLSIHRGSCQGAGPEDGIQWSSDSRLTFLFPHLTSGISGGINNKKERSFFLIMQPCVPETPVPNPHPVALVTPPRSSPSQHAAVFIPMIPPQVPPPPPSPLDGLTTLRRPQPATLATPPRGSLPFAATPAVPSSREMEGLLYITYECEKKRFEEAVEIVRLEEIHQLRSAGRSTFGYPRLSSLGFPSFATWKARLREDTEAREASRWLHNNNNNHQ